MMKATRIVFLIMLPLLADILFGCCKCIDPIYHDYTHCSITADNLDNSQSEPIISDEGTIPKQAYGIRSSLYRNTGTCQINTQGLSTMAYGMSCDCPTEEQFIARDSILSISIFTLTDFDGIQAGDEVTEFFRVFRSTEFEPVKEYFMDIDFTTSWPITDVVYFDFLPVNPPATGGEYHFSIEIELSDGRTLSASPPAVELT